MTLKCQKKKKNTQRLGKISDFLRQKTLRVKNAKSM